MKISQTKYSRKKYSRKSLSKKQNQRNKQLGGGNASANANAPRAQGSEHKYYLYC
jgi:hypothetical protein